jgi:hypothetical protein
VLAQNTPRRAYLLLRLSPRRSTKAVIYRRLGVVGRQETKVELSHFGPNVENVAGYRYDFGNGFRRIQ